MKTGRHAAVLQAGRPVVLCGPADDPRSVAQAVALAATPIAATILGGPLKAGDVDAATIAWADVSPFAVVEKPPGHVEDGTRRGRVMAIVLAEPSKPIAVKLCVTTETARALDPNAPDLDDGESLPALARAADRPPILLP